MATRLVVQQLGTWSLRQVSPIKPLLKIQQAIWDRRWPTIKTLRYRWSLRASQGRKQKSIIQGGSSHQVHCRLHWVRRWCQEEIATQRLWGSMKRGKWHLPLWRLGNSTNKIIRSLLTARRGSLTTMAVVEPQALILFLNHVRLKIPLLLYL